MVIQTPRLLPVRCYRSLGKLELERCLRSSMWKSLGTAEVWSLPTIDHGTVISPVFHKTSISQEFNQSRYSQNASIFGICIALRRKVRCVTQKRNERMGWQHTWATEGESSKEYTSL